MLRRDLLKAAACLPAAATAATRRPNIIVILADDLGYGDLGFQDSKDIPTPNLDQLARSGVRFTNAYVSHPFCSPTRAGLLTGRYQQRFGHENNPVYNPRDEVSGLPIEETTLPQVLAKAGYATGLVGKWHLGAAPKFHPMKRGFTEMFGFLGGGHDYFKAQLEGEPREYLIPIQRSGEPVRESEYLTDAFSREAAAFVERHRARPFFLYLAYNTPHTPLQVSEKYLDRFRNVADLKRRSYAAMVSSLDDGVGKVMDALRRTQLESDTLVLFLSDNGGPPAANASNNGPLRAAKGTVYEGGVRVPFLARWKGKLKPGVYREPVISLDIFPTAAIAAGADPAALTPLDGVDLLPHLNGESNRPPHESLFWRTGGGVSYAVRQGNWKLVKASGSAAPELYDLASDVGESRDLAPTEQAAVSKLQQAYDIWNRAMKPPVFPGPPPARNP
jgi:arylsulfatase A-like enzyme